MCGIFGIVAEKNGKYSKKFFTKTLEKLSLLSESRGKESAGFSFWDKKDNSINVLRAPVSISELIKHPLYTKYLDSLLNGDSENAKLHPFLVFGHSRLVTNGSQLEDYNNQPVVKDNIVGVHNGIVVNVDNLWKKHSDLKRKYDIDTEVILSVLRKNIINYKSIKKAVSEAVKDVFGTVAAALLISDFNKFIITTNNGSLYVLSNNKDLLIFASEKYILSKLYIEENLGNIVPDAEIKQILPNSGVIIDLKKLSFDKFEISMNGLPTTEDLQNFDDNIKITLSSVYEERKKLQRHSLVDLHEIAINPKASIEKKMLEYNWDRISRLRRCSKCLLPETFPFIIFDNKGVCNYCNNYVKKNQPKPIEKLMELVTPYKSKTGEPDCIVPYSGGRDSTYVLHFVKKELGLNPIAFTYDWGMVTDLARRNIARVCGRLGVENIIVSADIRWKRDNIRKNISAWLKSPDLGMIPLFMAGDKYFFYYCHQVKKQTGINLNIWGINVLENTDFKTGFAGVKPKFDKKRIYSLDFSSQIKLFTFVGKNILKSPGYINSSVFDTFGSFLVRYFYPKKDYYHLFDYLVWDEKTIENTILSEYDWETAVDTNSTWRIGDGTASFYNYIYFTVAGFTENDTFRSNQIREGLITRDEGLMKIQEENMPRYDTLKWYLEIVGLDYESVIKIINNIPKLY